MTDRTCVGDFGWQAGEVVGVGLGDAQVIGIGIIILADGAGGFVAVFVVGVAAFVVTGGPACQLTEFIIFIIDASDANLIRL